MGGVWALCALYGRPNDSLCSLYARYARPNGLDLNGRPADATNETGKDSFQMRWQPQPESR